MGEQEDGHAVTRYWQALETENFEAAKAELHEDFVESYPQSGERIRGTQTGCHWSPITPDFRRSRFAGSSAAEICG
jgi:hypothetical protein